MSRRRKVATKPRENSAAPIVAERVPYVWSVLAIILLTTLLVYLPTMRGQFLWDDDANVTSPELQSPAGLVRIWSELGATQQYYPLLHTVFWIEHQLWSEATIGYHLISLFWHMCSVVLVYAIFNRLKIPAAIFAASIFALHPVMVESVAWITEQKNTLSTVFYLCSVLAYLQFDESKRRSLYFASLGLFLLALLSKTAIVTLPAALLVIFWWQRGSLSWRRDVLPLVPFFLVAGLIGLITCWVEWHHVGAVGADFKLTPIQRFLLAGRAIWFYLWKLFWPRNLIFMYPRWDIDPSNAVQWLYPLAAVGMTAVLWALRNRSRAPLAAWLFFCGTLLPMLGLLNQFLFLYTFVSDHFQYVASLGIIALVAGFVGKGFASSSKSARVTIAGVCGIYLATLAALTCHQTFMYSDPVTLYRTTLERNPGCWMVYNNLGNYLSAHGRESEAEPLYRESLRLRPDNPEALTNLGWQIARAGRLDEAIDMYKRALAAKPNLFQAELNWGNTLVSAKRPQEAIAHYQAAAQLQPKSPLPEYNMGNISRVVGDAAGAIEHYKRSLQLNPDYAEAHLNFGLALAQTGQMNDAVNQFRSAIQLRPDFVEAHQFLGLALVQLKRDEDALAELRRTLQLDPNLLVVKLELAKVYARLKRSDNAIATAKEALTAARASGQSELVNAIEHWLVRYQPE
jgi:protein O-mannosyl-transferase